MKKYLVRYSVPLIVTIVCSLLALLPQQGYQLLAYSREHILDGQIWRLVTGHFLHTNTNHLLLNIAATFLYWFIYWDVVNRFWQWLYIIVPIIITSLLMLAFAPNMTGYVGLSAALHGTMIAFGMSDIKNNRLLSIGLIIGIWIKIIYEQLTGVDPSLKEMIEANVAIDAHLWGTVSGFFIGGAFWYFVLFKKNTIARDAF